METKSGQTSTSKPNTSASLTIDATSKAITGTIIVLLGCGYVITSICDSTYGFVQMNPFHPRVLSAGAWFLFLSAIGIYGGTLILIPWNPDVWKAWKEGAKSLWRYYVFCFFIGIFINHLLFSTSSSAEQLSVWRVVILFVSVAALVALDMFPRMSRTLMALLYLACTAIFLILAAREMTIAHHFGHGAISTWLFLIGLAAITQRAEIENGNWPVVAVTFLIFLAGFAHYGYPHIPASWGGGSPVPVTIYFTKNSVYRPDESATAFLLDESEAGFYILGTGENKAIFVPRGAVSLLYFSDRPADSHFLQQR